MSDSYATGDVDGYEKVGGLVGINSGIAAVIDNSYATGLVTGEEEVGGLVGYNAPNPDGVFDSFCDMETTGQENAIGTEDEGGTSTNVEALPPEEMKDISTFEDAGWDIEITSEGNPTSGYPFLSWQVNGSSTWYVFGFELTINAEGNGTSDPGVGTHSYMDGEEVTVEASADEGWEFESWSGDVEDNEKTITVIMDEDKEITANFVKIHNLSASSKPADGGSISISPSKDNYEPGTEVNVTAKTSEGYEFDHWSGDVSGTSKTKTVIIDSDKTITAHFVKIHNLSTNPTNGGTISVDPSKESYEQETEVTITAEPASGYEFVHWTGDVSGSDKSITVTMDSDKSVEAHFIRVHNLSKSLDPSKGGTISISPSGGTYEEGTEVTVTAEPASGYEFDHWAGDATGSDKTITVTVDSDKNIEAHFKKIEYSLATSVKAGEGSISLQPSGENYESGTEVTLTAEPASSYEFDHWSGDLSGASRTKTVTLNSDMSVTAYFTKTGGKEGGGLPLTWIAIGIGVVIAVVAGVAVVKKYSGEKTREQ